MRKLNIDLNEVYFEKIILNEPLVYDNTQRVLLVDADSILYSSIHELLFDTEEEQIEEAKFRVRNKMQEITNNVEKWFNIKSSMWFVSGKGNFRYSIYSEYKAKRAEKHPYIAILHKYIVDECGAIKSNGYEADDFLATAVKLSSNQCVCAYIDKDLNGAIYEVPIYNYRSHKEKLGNWYITTKKECRHNLAIQLCMGDSGDNVPGIIKCGPVKAAKLIKMGMSDYQYMKAILIAYIKAYGSKGKELMKLYYKLLKMHDITEENSVSLIK